MRNCLRHVRLIREKKFRGGNIMADTQAEPKPLLPQLKPFYDDSSFRCPGR